MEIIGYAVVLQTVSGFASIPNPGEVYSYMKVAQGPSEASEIGDLRLTLKLKGEHSEVIDFEPWKMLEDPHSYTAHDFIGATVFMDSREADDISYARQILRSSLVGECKDSSHMMRLIDMISCP